MRRIGLILCALWPAIAVAQTGLEFLEPKKLAYVEVKGMVREYLTNVPIAGATVLAVWQGTTRGFHSSNRHCLRIDATRTGPDGSFSLVTAAKSVYRDGMSMQYVDIRIHRDGMEERFAPGKTSRTMKRIEDRRSALSKLFGPKEVGLDLDARMVKVTEDIPDRLRTLNELSEQPTDCETKGDPAGILSFFGASAAEAMSLAKTRYQRALAQAMTSYARMVFSSYKERSAAREAIQWAAYPLDPEDTEWRDEENRTPLMRAAEYGNVETVRALLASGANPNRTRRTVTRTGGAAR